MKNPERPERSGSQISSADWGGYLPDRDPPERDRERALDLAA